MDTKGVSVRSGIGAERDEALSHGTRHNSKTQNLANGLERQLHCLGQGVQHPDLANGDLCSLDSQGGIIPLDPSCPFAGLISGIGEERGVYKVSTLIRGSISVRVEGLTAETQLGSKVYAVRSGQSEAFSFDGPGTVIGELVGIESVERCMGIVGIKLSSDTRPFISGGDRRGGLVQSKT